MNLKDYPRRDYAIDQFTQPHCSELEGKSFKFIMDGGYDYELNITGETSCTWNRVGEAPTEATYQCLKADDTTYLLHYDFMNGEHRSNHLYIIDLEQSLVTMVTCIIGLNPQSTNLKVSEDGGDVDAITGSTITSRAFLRAVQQAYYTYMGKGADASTGATMQEQNN